MAMGCDSGLDTYTLSLKHVAGPPLAWSLARSQLLLLCITASHQSVCPCLRPVW